MLALVLRSLLRVSSVPHHILDLVEILKILFLEKLKVLEFKIWCSSRNRIHILTLNFVDSRSNIVATGVGTIANIQVSTSPTYDQLNVIGVATFKQINLGDNDRLNSILLTLESW